MGYKNLLVRDGMQGLFNEGISPYTQNTYGKIYNRVTDIFNQESFSTTRDISSRLGTYGFVKPTIGREVYLTEMPNIKHRSCLSKFRLSNHKLEHARSR